MRRGSVLQLVVIAAIAGGIATAVAIFLPWLPRPASREAGRIDFVFWFVTGICIFIFAIVAAVIVYSILHFRAQPDDDSDGPPIHGHTQIEIAWTAIPVVLVTAIAIVSAIVLARNDARGSNPLNVDVYARQFAWSFSYPDAHGKTSPVLYLPKGRSVVLRLNSADVIHAFWVPEFGQSQDLVPGLHPTLHITPDRIGTYPVICTELCGLGHAIMRTRTIVMSPADFTKWEQGGGGATAGAAGGLAIFNGSSGCSSCHTLTKAGAQGAIGPNLDKLPAEASRAGKPLIDFVRQSIVDPNAYIEPGFPKNLMPGDFGTKLTKTQLDALVQYLVSSTSKGSAK